MRDWLEQLDLERLVAECRATTHADEAAVRDALLDVLSAMWQKRKELQGKFDTLGGFARYTKISTLRHLIRRQGRLSRQQPLELERLADTTRSPEEQVLAMLSHQDGARWLEEARVSLRRKEADALGQLIAKVIASPEMYIRTRQSGQEAGQYVFHTSRLAQDLGWPRRKVTARLEALRKALVRQSRKRSAQSPYDGENR